MLDPNFDPLEDLITLMKLATAQHHQIDTLIEALNEHNRAIQNINNVLKITKHQLMLMETSINDIKQTTTSNRQRRE